MEISSTPPSQPGSISHACLKVSVAAPAGIAMLGDTNTLWLAEPRSVANARLGAVSGFVTLVAHKFAVPDNVLVVHPAGSAGAPTPSKFCERMITGLPTWNAYVRFFDGPPLSVIPSVAVNVALHAALTVNE